MESLERSGLFIHEDLDDPPRSRHCARNYTGRRDPPARCKLARAMRAMLLDHPGMPLRLADMPMRAPAAGEILIRVAACGVCRTDLHIADGDLPAVRSPIVPGHEIVGVVEGMGVGVADFALGERVGVPWLGWTCGHCTFCASGRENLCDGARFTGYHIDGGYADYAIADARFCFKLPAGYANAEAAPLLCAGLIGYRSLIAAGDARRLGIYGFGAAAHIICQVALWQRRTVYAFTRPGDLAGQGLARELGASWVGDSTGAPPEQLDAAILFAPVGALVPLALRATAKGGVVVCAGIHMSAIPSFPYELLWGERRIVSVANLTRRDGTEFLALAPKVPVQTRIIEFPLVAANDALGKVRAGRIKGAAVLKMT
jgi:propanol-preferring alcohol dehydrogenase